MNNLTVLGGGKCPPGWDPVAGTCYMYVGAPMTYEEARLFCLVSILLYSLNSNSKATRPEVITVYYGFNQADEGSADIALTDAGSSV